MGWLTLGMKLLPYIVEAVSWVEKFVTEKGQRKQDAAVYMVKSTLNLVEAGANRNLLDDDDVEAATRSVIDSVVHLQNLIAKKRSE
jgi:hypothetical protein|tara:strand:- start:33845 stop:34102 length:258 start_codon:yes stop_codon:yes gene_type:complete